MKVSEAMTSDVKIAQPDQTIQDAARLMLEIDCGFLPVGQGDRIVGMVTDRDIAVRAIACGKGPQTAVREVMTGDVKYCFEEEDLAYVAQNMGEQQLRRLPVVNRDKRLVGVLSLADIVIFGGGHRAGNALEGIAQAGGEHTQRVNN
jgi:CBS domain-containing protein